MKNVLLIASEAVPFIKTGGLADVAGSLPKYFDKTKFDVRVMIPKYTCIPWEYREKMVYKTHFYIDLAWRTQYVVKARMKAILRRNAVTEKKAAKSNIINAGDMKIDCDSRNLYIAGRPINLTAKEFDLLELLAVNPGKVYSRDNLLKAVWGQDYSGDGRTVDVHMRRLREKIEDNPSEALSQYCH